MIIFEITLHEEASDSYRIYCYSVDKNWSVVCGTADELNAFAERFPAPKSIISQNVSDVKGKGKRAKLTPPVLQGSAAFGNYLHTVLLPRLRDKEAVLARRAARTARLTTARLIFEEGRQLRARARKIPRYTYDQDAEDEEDVRTIRRSKRYQDDDEEFLPNEEGEEEKVQHIGTRRSRRLHGDDGNQKSEEDSEGEDSGDDGDKSKIQSRSTEGDTPEDNESESELDENENEANDESQDESMN